MTFRDIYDHHKNQIFNLCLNYLQNYEDAEEVTQDVFVAVHRSLHMYRNDAKLSTWIYRIAINKCLDALKAKKRQKRLAVISSWFSSDTTLPEPAAFDHPGIKMEQKESLKRIFGWINELPHHQKTALILSKMEDKSQKEIAEILTISTKAVESLLQRAKKQISKKIAANEG